MSFQKNPFFKALFDASVPRVILKGDSPNFTIIAINRAYREVNYTPNKNVAGHSWWDAFDPKEYDRDGLLRDALEEAVKNRLTINMPPVSYPVPEAKDGNMTANWFQLEIIPVADSDDEIYLVITLNNVTSPILARENISDDPYPAGKQLFEKLDAVNEELPAGNKDLSATIEELSKLQQQLQESNIQLEKKVEMSTKALAENEAEAQAIKKQLASISEKLIVSNQALLQSQAELQRTLYDLMIANQNTEHNQKLFRSIALSIPNSLVFVIDKDHHFITVEGDLINKSGYDGNSYKDKHPAEVSFPEKYETWRNLYDRVLTGEQFSTEQKSEAGNDLIVHFVPLKNDQEEVYAGLIIALDVTDNKTAEKNAARLVAIIESSDDAIISKTLDGIITSWNHSAERTFGYKPEEIIGQSIFKLIPEDRQHEEPAILARLRRGERVQHFETQRITKDGRLIDLSLTISPVKDKQGNIIGLSKIARDISERKKNELRKNDFIGMVSHELKTPLTTLTALIQVSNAKLKNNEDLFLAGAMEKANLQVKKMSNMINGFLNISRLESGKILIDKQKFNLESLIEEIIQEVELTMLTHRIVFKTNKPALVNADRDKIGSVISNLISNAVKYSPQGTTIIITHISGENTTSFSIKDEGIGIKPADLKKLFDRYYRVESPGTSHISGFGIGLYLSAEIIHRHEGKIWVESEPGFGSIFHFSLPLNA